MSRLAPPETLTVPGPAGAIEVTIDFPAEVHGIALVCHPHPLFGGANTNKVAHTLARTLRDLGYVALRPNFRGVGGSEGTHDEGIGETEDMLSLISRAQSRWGALPLVLAGFSFGGYVTVRVANPLAGSVTPPQRLILVGMAAGDAADGSRHYDTPTLPPHIPALLIHGEHDETVPLGNVLEWARPQNQPVVVVPGADHFFHGRLNVIRSLVLANRHD